MHNLLTVKETAKYLRIPLPTVYYLVQRGQLPAIQIGGRWRIKKSSLDKDILKEDKSGQPTVLVVDDDESLQNLFKLFLKKIGFSRVVVGTVKEALVALDKSGTFFLAADTVSLRSTLDTGIIPRNTWNAEALTKSLAEVRRIEARGTAVLCGHDDAQWASLRKGADAYE